MRNLLNLAFLLCLSFQTNAATDITTPTVSGYWTLAGSPYRIFNDISVASGQTLTIQAGVEVIFQGTYSVTVTGTLIAAGSVGLPIQFHAQDATTGWRGITFNDSVAGAADLSAIDYSVISDMKAGGLVRVSANRKLDFKYCTFRNNNTDLYVMWVTGIININNCDFYDNSANRSIVDIQMGPNKSINSCNIYNNTTVFGIIRINPLSTIPSLSTVLIEGCNIYQNNCISLTGTESGSAIINWANNNVIVRKNRIYNNKSFSTGAVTMNGGTGDINGNLVCNNEHTNYGSCGAAEGGGGIRLTVNVGPNNFTVRNNIIVNNHSGYLGGGISVYRANVKITNNTIANNSVSSAFFDQGAGISVIQDSGTAQTIYIKNNIIYNNRKEGTGELSNICETGPGGGGTMLFEHNWLQRPLFLELGIWSSSTVHLGDTLTNVIGTIPGFVAPTLTCLYTESALAANFGLLNSSHCINTGDSTGTLPYTTDYNNIDRVKGTVIDIGACEFNSFCPEIISGITDICAGGVTTLSHSVSGGTWSSANSPMYVTVNAATGTVTGIKKGTAAIYYHVGGCVAGTNVKVNSLPTISDSGNICAGLTKPLSASIPGGTWTSSNMAAISIAPTTGVATGIDTGTANITYTTPAGCFHSVVMTAISCFTDVNEIEQANHMSVHPNPVTNTVYITTNKSSGTLFLRNITGAKVAEVDVRSRHSTLDVHSLPRGVYIAVWNHDGKSDTQKVIVQ